MSSDDRDERPKLSWREIDQRRSGGRARRDEPRGHAARLEQARVRSDVLEKADAMFSLGKGGAEGAQLAKAMRDAQGGEGFLDACQSYCDAVGLPRDPSLLSLLLDTGERALVVPALEALLEIQQTGQLELRAGLKSQLRVLTEAADDTIAGISEELLED